VRKILRFIFSKRFIAVLLALIQITTFILLTSRLYTLGSSIYMALMVFSIGIMLYLFERDNLNPSYKLLWTVVMVIFPVTGALFYFFWGDTKLTKKQQLEINRIRERAWQFHDSNADALEKLQQYDPSIAKQARFLDEYAKATPYYHTQTKYYPMGEDFFADYIQDLKNAKKSIFMHYFIVDEGYMWDTILGILKAKVKEGVEFWIMTNETHYNLASRCDVAATLEEAGVTIARDTCVMEMEEGRRWAGQNFVTNSGKVAQYAPGINRVNIRMASIKGCVEAAVTGKFPKEDRGAS